MKKTIQSLLTALLLGFPAGAQTTNDAGLESKPPVVLKSPGISVPVTTVYGVIGSGSGGSCETQGISPSRLFRTGAASSCASPKAPPGPFGAGGFYYDTYTLTNGTGSTKCVDMTIASGTGSVLLLVYNGAFNPSDLNSNYLADTGSSLAG